MCVRGDGGKAAALATDLDAGAEVMRRRSLTISALSESEPSSHKHTQKNKNRSRPRPHFPRSPRNATRTPASDDARHIRRRPRPGPGVCPERG